MECHSGGSRWGFLDGFGDSEHWTQAFINSGLALAAVVILCDDSEWTHLGFKCRLPLRALRPLSAVFRGAYARELSGGVGRTMPSTSASTSTHTQHSAKAKGMAMVSAVSALR